MSGYFAPEGKPVTWRGLTSVYAPPERAIMRELPVREQAVIHLLKASTHGEIRTPLQEALPSQSGDAGPEKVPVEISNTLDAQRHPQRLDQRLRSHGEDSGVDLPSDRVPLLYIDPEDIPFGEGLSTSGKPDKPRKRPIYALVWTWRQNRTIEPDPKRPGKKRPLTKGRATRSMRVWKKWYERQGWKVTRHGTGYWANGPQGEKHAIGIHEYDPETKERLK